METNIKVIPKHKKEKKSFSLIYTILGIILAIYAISMILLLVWGIISSFKSNVDFLNGNSSFGLPRPKFSHKEMAGRNYELIFNNFDLKVSTAFYTWFGEVYRTGTVDFWGMLVNTILYALVGAIIVSGVPMVCAYICAKYKNGLTRVLYFTNLVVLALPIIGAEPSNLTLMRNIGLYDTFLGTWVQRFNFTGMYFFVFYAYFDSLTDTYSEAADIDGASQFRIMVSINLPLAIKMFMTVVLIQFVSLWNNYQNPLLYLPTHPTLACGINQLVVSDANRLLSKTPIKIAACMALALPILVLFIAFKDKIMGDISLGGVKE